MTYQSSRYPETARLPLLLLFLQQTHTHPRPWKLDTETVRLWRNNKLPGTGYYNRAQARALILFSLSDQMSLNGGDQERFTSLGLTPYNIKSDERVLSSQSSADCALSQGFNKPQCSGHSMYSTFSIPPSPQLYSPYVTLLTGHFTQAEENHSN